MADTDLGLTDREKELKKWEAPYRYQEFPKMLFRGMTTTQGRVEVERRIVAGEREETLAKESGWANSSAQAAAVETGRQEALGTAAAERAWDDRRVSAAAQAEVAVAEAATTRHLGEIPRRPVKRKSHKKKKPSPPPPPPDEGV
jgi:hypothetical protein